MARQRSPTARHIRGRAAAEKPAVSIAELVLAFWEWHVQRHYRGPDGRPSNEVIGFRMSPRPLRELYGLTAAAEFTPGKLKAVRERMVQLGWSRKTVNQRVSRVKHLFRWATDEEMVPPTVYGALATVKGLQPGRSAAPECEPVGPVDDGVVEKTLPHLTRHVRAMVQLQRLSRMRPGKSSAGGATTSDRAGLAVRPARAQDRLEGQDPTHRPRPAGPGGAEGVPDWRRWRRVGALRHYREVWAVDFEFAAPPGHRPAPLCVAARELRSGRLARRWLEGGDPGEPPSGTGPDTLLVAYDASAEWGRHLQLGWPVPARVLDLYAEFRRLTSGAPAPAGYGLLGALAYHGRPAVDAAEKQAMRDLALRGGPFSPAERAELLAYCQTDVDALARLLPAMLPAVDLPRALLRGRYTVAAARIERVGVPIDTDAHARLLANWDRIRPQPVPARRVRVEDRPQPAEQRPVHLRAGLLAAVAHQAGRGPGGRVRRLVGPGDRDRGGALGRPAAAGGVRVRRPVPVVRPGRRAAPGGRDQGDPRGRAGPAQGGDARDALRALGGRAGPPELTAADGEEGSG